MNLAQKIGQQLKEWRLAKGTTLETIAEQTKISINTLKRLEDGDFTQLPSYTYTRGFIKNYLRILKRDFTGELGQELKHAYEELGLPTGPSFQALEREDSQLKEWEDLSLHTLKKVFNAKLFILLGVVGVIAAGFYFFKHINVHNFTNYSAYFQVKPDKGSSDTKHPPQKIQDILESPQENVATPEPTSEPTQVVVNEEAKAPEDDGDNSPSEDFPYIGFKKIDDDLGIVLKADTENVNNEQIFPLNFKNLAPSYSEEQILFVHAYTGDSWISYKTDNSEVKSYTLRLGEKIVIRGKIIFFSSGNIGALRIFNNGQEVGSNQPTSVKNFIFPPSAASQYSLPLFVANKRGAVFFYQQYLKKMQPKPTPSPTPVAEI